MKYFFYPNYNTYVKSVHREGAKAKMSVSIENDLYKSKSFCSKNTCCNIICFNLSLSGMFELSGKSADGKKNQRNRLTKNIISNAYPKIYYMV